MLSSTWQQIRCADCGGHGLVSGYTADGSDFTGADECRTSAGRGSVWLSAKGVLALYPGGPFLGRLGADELRELSNYPFSSTRQAARGPTCVEIREQNATRPRCVQCESDLVDWAGRCVVSAEEEQQCGGEFIRGDLLCVWCWQALFHPDEPGDWQWGHA